LGSSQERLTTRTEKGEPTDTRIGHVSVPLGCRVELIASGFRCPRPKAWHANPAHSSFRNGRQPACVVKLLKFTEHGWRSEGEEVNLGKEIECIRRGVLPLQGCVSSPRQYPGVHSSQRIEVYPVAQAEHFAPLNVGRHSHTPFIEQRSE